MSICVFVMKALANLCTNMVLLYNEASYWSRQWLDICLSLKIFIISSLLRFPHRLKAQPLLIREFNQREYIPKSKHLKLFEICFQVFYLAAWVPTVYGYHGHLHHPGQQNRISLPTPHHQQ